MKTLRRSILKHLRAEKRREYRLKDLPINRRNQLSVWYHRGVTNTLRKFLKEAEDFLGRKEDNFFIITAGQKDDSPSTEN